MNKGKDKVYKNAMMLYIMTGAKYVLPFVISASLTRKLGPDCYGIVTYVSSIMTFFLYIFDFGFNYSATKYIAQHRDEIGLVQKKVNEVFTSKVFLVIASIIVLLAITPCIEILRENLLLTILFFISQAINIFIPDFVYRGMERMGVITARYLIGRTISAVLIVILIGNSNDLLLLPVMYIIGTAASAVFSLMSLKRDYGIRLGLTSLREAFSELKESAIYFLSTFASIALGYFITFVMGVVNTISADEIAFWGVALQIIQAIQALYDPITSSLYPHISKSGDYRMVIKITCLLEMVVLIGCVALYFLSGFCVGILAGEGYEQSAVLVNIMIPLVICSFPSQMLGFPLLGSMGRQKQVTISTVATALIQVVIIIFLIVEDSFTVTTAAVSKNMCELLLLIIRGYFVIKLIRETGNNDKNRPDNFI